MKNASANCKPTVTLIKTRKYALLRPSYCYWLAVYHVAVFVVNAHRLGVQPPLLHKHGLVALLTLAAGLLPLLAIAQNLMAH